MMAMGRSWEARDGKITFRWRRMSLPVFLTIKGMRGIERWKRERYQEQGSCRLAQAAINWEQRYGMRYWVFEAWISGDNVSRIRLWPSLWVQSMGLTMCLSTVFLNCISQCISQLYLSTVLLLVIKIILMQVGECGQWSWQWCLIWDLASSFFLKVHSGKRLKRPHKRTFTTSSRELQFVSKHRNSNPQHKLMLEHTMPF